MRRWLVVFTTLGLLFLVALTGCGGGESDSTLTAVQTSTVSISNSGNISPVATSTPGLYSTATVTSSSANPVKIGAIGPWSGTMAMSGVLADQAIDLIEWQVKNMGGILGGREVKFVRGDDRGMVAEAAGQARKLILDEKVCILTLGGVSAAHFTAVAEVAEELEVPYVAMSTVYGVKEMKYCVSLYWHEAVMSRIANFIIDVVKPRTVAYLAYDQDTAHGVIDGKEGVAGIRERLKPEGIEIISEQYFPQETMDFSSYLTKIKFLDPDILVTFFGDTGQAVIINKQISELGGWGDMEYFCSTESGSAQSAIKIPSALGTYVSVLWMPDSDEPGMKEYEDIFREKYGRAPTPDTTYFYNDFWTAIKAIELAGSDEPGQIALALRSGNLEWDSAWGPMHIGTDGIGTVKPMVAQVQEGPVLVKVWP